MKFYAENAVLKDAIDYALRHNFKYVKSYTCEGWVRWITTNEYHDRGVIEWTRSDPRNTIAKFIETIALPPAESSIVFHTLTSESCDWFLRLNKGELKELEEKIGEAWLVSKTDTELTEAILSIVSECRKSVAAIDCPDLVNTFK